MLKFKRKKVHQLESLASKMHAKPEYQRMLNNLLGIGNQDSSIMASSRTSNFDLQKILETEDFESVFQNKAFKVNIKDIDSDVILADLSSAKNFNEFMDIATENGLFISISNRKLLKTHFTVNKEKIIEKFAKQKNFKIGKWRKFKNKYLDKQAQINSWPLYIGTMFIKVNTESTALYGPLILKKVEINITQTNKVQIQTLDKSVDINEKLLFLLQDEFNISLPNIDEEAEMSFDEVIKLFSGALQNVISRQINFKKEFIHLNRKGIKNDKLQYAPGAALSLVSPTGGKLRDKLIELVQKDKIEDLLDFDVMKNIKKEVEAEIEEGKGIFRITPTDLSQEKAVMGALKDNSIIWGPPGTGKSQTIANILANLLYLDKRVLVTSEKKAALDVIKNRMGKLDKFMFFGLTDKKINKQQFYRPFNQLAKVVKDTNAVAKSTPKSMIAKEYRDYLKQKEGLADEDIISLTEIYNVIAYKYPRLFKKIKSYHKATQKLPQVVKALQVNGNVFEVLKKENIKKTWPFARYPRSARLIIKLLKQIEGNVEFIKILNSISNIKHLLKLQDFRNIELNYALHRSQFTNDEDYLDAVLTKRFREKILELRKNEKLGKQINNFIKNSASGFRVPYKFVSIYKEVIEKLFNVFVSTPQSLSATIDMNSQFDTAIFDEASQLHLEKGLPFISIAKKSIIAGDFQQMQPSDWMRIRDRSTVDVEAEVNVDSLLDYSYRKGLKDSREYMLTKNYRSAYAQLMAFSSHQFYNSELDVIDSCHRIGKFQPIEVFDVKGKWEGQVNQKEAIAILNKLISLKNKYPKIILLTLNSAQKQFIESLIYSENKYNKIIDMLQEEQVVLRNLENIQGDEAELVMVSVAYDKSANLGSTYVARPEGKNALNVAISRAKEKMIIFKSITPDEVKGNVDNDSIRVFREWLTFLEMKKEKQKKYAQGEMENYGLTNSAFKAEIYDFIKMHLRVKSTYFITSQYQIGSYQIDQAIIDSETQGFVYGIEIDSYEEPATFDNIKEKLDRQMFLETKGYPLYRITELNWRTNKEKIVQELQHLVNK